MGGIKIRRVLTTVCSLFMQLYKRMNLNVHVTVLIRRKLYKTVRRFDFNLAMESVHVWGNG